MHVFLKSYWPLTPGFYWCPFPSLLCSRTNNWWSYHPTNQNTRRKINNECNFGNSGKNGERPGFWISRNGDWVTVIETHIPHFVMSTIPPRFEPSLKHLGNYLICSKGCLNSSNNNNVASFMYNVRTSKVKKHTISFQAGELDRIDWYNTIIRLSRL